MAQGDAVVHNNLKEQFFRKTIDFLNDDLRIALYTASYTWSPDGADTAYSATNEIVASGYTAAGKALASKAVAQNDTSDNANFDAADCTWTALAAASPRHALLYDNTTVTKWVLAHWELTTDSNGGDYTLQFHSTGILVIS